MKKIGLLSDTHGYLDDSIFKYFAEVDEVWHAGDIGSMQVVEKLEQFKPLKAVFGNIDGGVMRRIFPLDLRFECGGMQIWITHIGGYPGRYNKRTRAFLESNAPNLFICGHSHILKIIPDKKYNLLHINPGACGNHGFHKVRTIVRFTIENSKIIELDVIELGKRGN